MSKNRQYYGICKPQAWEPRYLDGMVMFGSTEFDVRGRLAECRTQFKYGENEPVWKPVRTIFNAFADAEIARARLDDTSPDSPPDITAERAAAYINAKDRLEDVREESGMFGDDDTSREINRTITDLEITYRRLARLEQSSIIRLKPSQPKTKPHGHSSWFRKGGRRTRHRKGTTRHQRKKRSSRYKTYRKSAA